MEKREAFVGTLERMLTGIVLNNWKEHVKMKKSLRWVLGHYCVVLLYEVYCVIV